MDAVSKNQKQRPSLLSEVLFLIGKILLIVIFIVLLGTLLFKGMRNTETGMLPAIKHGDLVLCYRLDKNYIFSDVIALKYEGEEQLRRVVAVAGDTVDITEDGLLINGGLQQESEVLGDTLAYSDGIGFPVTVGEGQVFVLGDNREQALDSRWYGLVEIEDTYGKAMLILRRRNI